MTNPPDASRSSTRTRSSARFLAQTTAAATLLALGTCSAPDADTAQGELQPSGPATGSSASESSPGAGNEMTPLGSSTSSRELSCRASAARPELRQLAFRTPRPRRPFLPAAQWRASHRLASQIQGLAAPGGTFRLEAKPAKAWAVEQTDTHGAYPRAMRELAMARDVSLVDATALTKAYFERIGPAATNEYFMNLAPGQFPNYPDGSEDNTHLREGGAMIIAQIVLADLYAQRLEPGTLANSMPVAP